MSILKAALSIQDFDPDHDKIALMLKSFTVKVKDKGLGKKNRHYLEPYIIGMSIAQNGIGNLGINLANASYPNTRMNDKKEFIGNGLRIYGPENPGDFLVFEILVMESNQNIRDAGMVVEQVMMSDEIKHTLLPKLALNPTLGLATQVLSTVSRLVAKILQDTKDQQLLRVHGTLMRDIMGTEDLPFMVGKTISDQNDMAHAEFNVIGLGKGDRHKRQTQLITGQ
jgi:hypothetical protein